MSFPIAKRFAELRLREDQGKHGNSLVAAADPVQAAASNQPWMRVGGACLRSIEGQASGDASGDATQSRVVLFVQLRHKPCNKFSKTLYM